MTKLSPAAQAVLDAYRSSHLSINNLAAALRAAADQVVPWQPEPTEESVDPTVDFGYAWALFSKTNDVRQELHVIADELEAQQPPSLPTFPMTQHPITPPPELAAEWIAEIYGRIETLEDAAHKHIVETRANILALASRVDALELTERRLSKALDISDLPQLTPEQVQNLQDLLGTYRNHLGLNN